MQWINHCSLQLKVKAFVHKLDIGFLADLGFEPVTSTEQTFFLEKVLLEMHKKTYYH